MQFSEMATRLDMLEEISWDWPGGAPVSIQGAIKLAETAVFSAEPQAGDLPWLFARLVRAFENGWCEESLAPLRACIGRARCAA